MKTKMSAKYIVSDEGLEIYYWIDTRKKSGGKKNFIFLHPGSSMNHTSLEPLEQLLDKDNTILINIDPRGTGYSQAPNDKKHFGCKSGIIHSFSVLHWWMYFRN